MTVSFPPMSAGLGLPVVYGVYGAMALLSGLFVWRFVAETRGKELEDMTD